VEQQKGKPPKQAEEGYESKQDTEFKVEDEAITTKSEDSSVASKKHKKQKRSALDRVREEYEEPTLLILAHGFLTAFGIGLLSVLSLLIDIAHFSETTKYVLHIIDEYLTVFAFVILGIAFIIKIVTVSLRGRGDEEEDDE
jgi:hypothetical protein